MGLDCGAEACEGLVCARTKEEAHAERDLVVHYEKFLNNFFPWRDVPRSCGFGERVCREQWEQTYE